MKKLFLWLLPIFFLTSMYGSDILLEFNAAWFYPTNSTTRDIYDTTGIYRLEGTWCGCNNFNPFASAGIVRTSGKSIGEKDNTCLTYVPLALGLKYMCCFQCISPYVGAGVLVSYLHTKDDSPFVVKVRNDWGIGATVKGGFYYDFFRCFFLDVFVDYSYMRIDTKDTDKTLGRTADLSAVSVGAGIGYRF